MTTNPQRDFVNYLACVRELLWTVVTAFLFFFVIVMTISAIGALTK